MSKLQAVLDTYPEGSNPAMEEELRSTTLDLREEVCKDREETP